MLHQPSPTKPAIQLGFLSYAVFTKEIGVPGVNRYLPGRTENPAGLWALLDWTVDHCSRGSFTFKSQDSPRLQAGLNDRRNIMERSRKMQFQVSRQASVMAEAHVNMFPVGSLTALFEGPVCHCVGILM